MGIKVKLNNQDVENEIMNNFKNLGFEIVMPKDEEEQDEEVTDSKKNETNKSANK